METKAAMSELAETGQLTMAVKPPLPRRKLNKGTVALLILLRVYVFLAIPVVAYAFIRALEK